MNYTAARRMFSKLEIPSDYYKGKGNLVFPPPENILLFYRDSFHEKGLGTQTYFHYRYVTIFNLQDSITIFVDGTGIRIKSGEGLLILPYQYHRFLNEGQRNLSLAFITFSMADNIFFENLRNAPFSYDQYTLDLITSITDCYRKNGHRMLPYLTGVLFAHIAQYNETSPSTAYEQNCTNTLAIQICKTVYRNKSVKIKDLSQILGYSESYLRAYFKKTMNLSLGHFITEIRLTEAIKLLSRSEEQVTLIAEKCGYESVYAFSRSFKAHIGVSPSKYRYKARDR